MAYNLGQVQDIQSKGRFNPFKALAPVVHRLATPIRRPHGYEGQKWGSGGGLLNTIKEMIKGDKTYNVDEGKGSFTNRLSMPLYDASLGKGKEGGAFTPNEEGVYSLDPENPDAKSFQSILNQAFTNAKTEGSHGWSKSDQKHNYIGGKKYAHPDIKGSGEDYYKAKVDALGDVYFDEEGNYVDYYNYGLDKGEKVWGGPGSIMPGGEPWINKTNLLRAVVSPFTTPPTVTGRAVDTGQANQGVGAPSDVQAFAGSQAPKKEGWYPGKNIKKLSGLLGGIKDKLTTDRSPIELEMPEVRDMPEELLSERNMPGRLDQPDMSAFRGPIQTATDPRHLARTIDVQNPESVKAFQEATGLTADGILGPKTLAKLREIQGIQ